MPPQLRACCETQTQHKSDVMTRVGERAAPVCWKWHGYMALR